MPVGDIDGKRQGNGSKGARQERAGDLIAFAHKRPELVHDPAIAPEKKAGEAPLVLGDQRRLGQTPGEAAQQRAAVGAEDRGVVGDDFGPVRWIEPDVP